MSAAPTEYRLDELRVHPDAIGEGGAADIYRCEIGDRTMVFKRHNADALKDLDVKALRHLVSWPAQLSEPDRQRLMRICAWPQAVVVDGGSVVGILMAEASPEFFFRNNGNQLKPCHFELLGIRQEVAQKRQWPYYDFPHKIARLGYLLEDLVFLHSHGVVVGDLQIKNILTTTADPDSSGLTTKILLLDCDSFIVDGQAALPPMDPPNMRFPYPTSGHSAGTDLYKFALVTVRCLSETLTAGAINYEKFTGLLPSSHLVNLEKLLTEQDAGLAAADLGNMAKAWQATVKKDGRLYCRTDASIWEKWTSEKRQAHLADITSPPLSSIPSTSGGPAKAPQTVTSGESLKSRGDKPTRYEGSESSVSLPSKPKSDTPSSSIVAWAGLGALVAMLIGLILVGVVNAHHSNQTSNTYTTTPSNTVMPTTSPNSSNDVVRNAQTGDCVTYVPTKNADGTEQADVETTSCENHASDSYQVVEVTDDYNKCTTTISVQTGDLPRRVLCLAHH